MEPERVVLFEEAFPGNTVKLTMVGAVDESFLEALESYIARQRRKLEKSDD
jgi:hypothetical protein